MALTRLVTACVTHSRNSCPGDERNLIELEESATNHEYLSKVSRFSRLVGPMRYLTDRFDYVWYGMFPSSEEDFAAYLASYLEAMEGARTLSAQPAS